MEDLVLLDSFLRTPNDMTDELGALTAPVQCNADVDRNFSLSGLRLGLPSNFGWVNPGLSGEVRFICRSMQHLVVSQKCHVPCASLMLLSQYIKHFSTIVVIAHGDCGQRTLQ